MGEVALVRFFNSLSVFCVGMNKYMISGFCPVQFQEYFLCRISETKNSKKQELVLWHLVNMLVPKNA